MTLLQSGKVKNENGILELNLRTQCRFREITKYIIEIPSLLSNGSQTYLKNEQC